MEQHFIKAIAGFILPPTGLIILAMIGIGVSLLWKKLGLWVAALSLAGLLLCSLPAVSALLIDTLQTDLPIPDSELKKNLAKVDAVVVLAGGRRSASEEFGDDTVSGYSLERARYAAWIVKRTGLPLIISGGRVHNEHQSEAQLMQQLLQKEFIVIVDHLEEQSRSTFENAKYTAQYLKENELRSIALVTHAWHMPRAKAAFAYFDIQVIPAPTAFYGRLAPGQPDNYLPSSEALKTSGLAFHEIFGQWWYGLRYY
ncbi:MAG TPA: YdcF family protein [Gammaproteobacteria bacterium]